MPRSTKRYKHLVKARAAKKARLSTPSTHSDKDARHDLSDDLSPESDVSFSDPDTSTSDPSHSQTSASDELSQPGPSQDSSSSSDSEVSSSDEDADSDIGKLTKVNVN